MAPLRSVEEIRNQIRVFESIMKTEQRVFRFAPGITCMVCSETFEETPEMLITILRHTYCKICIEEKLQTDNADEFIIGFIRGSVSSSIFNRGYDNSENTSSQDSNSDSVSLESSDEDRGLPRGYIYPKSNLMPKVEEGNIGNKKRPYSSLRMNAKSKLMKKVQKGVGKKKGSFSSLRMNAKEEIVRKKE